MASAKNNQLISSQGPHFSTHSTTKTNDRSINLGRWHLLVCDRFSIVLENPYEEVDDDENDIYYYYWRTSEASETLSGLFN